MSEKFCLKWNDFHSFHSTSFGTLRNEEYLHDVTLVTDDHHQISAHKLVLSACSQYFKNIFKNNSKHSHPLLCLEGISSKQLSMIMDYVYNGEVQIFQEDLDQFLGVACRLKIEGLLGNEDSTAEVKNENMPNEDKLMVSNPEFLEDVNEAKSVVRKKHKVVDEKIIVSTAATAQDIDQVNAEISKYIEKTIEGAYKCALCGKIAKQSTHIRTHIETHLEGLQFPCQDCGKIFRSRSCLRSHKFVMHKF